MRIGIIIDLGFVLRPFKHVNTENQTLKTIGDFGFDVLI